MSRKSTTRFVHVPISKPCPMKDILIDGERRAETKAVKSTSPDTRKTELFGNKYLPSLRRAIIQRAKETKTAMEIKTLLENWKGKAADGTKNIGRRKAVAMSM